MPSHSISRARPKFEHALAFLKQTSQTGDAPTYHSVKHLAARAGVSYVTMWKAVSELRAHQKNTLSIADEAGHAGRHGDLLWKRLCSDLEARILSGTYPPSSSLPSHKQLQSGYASSHATVKKALQRLCDQRLIVPYGRGFKVRGFSRANGNFSIALIIPFDYSAHLFWGRQGRDYTRVFELACATLGVGLEVICWKQSAGKTEFMRSSGEPVSLGSAGCNGYVYLVTGQDDEHAATIDGLLAQGVPVAVLDESGEWLCPSRLRNRKGLCIFPIATSSSTGSSMARYLLQLGHQRVAWFSPFHDANWSRERLTGIQTTFSKAGFPQGVGPYTFESREWTAAIYKTPPGLRRVIDVFRRSQPPAIIAHLEPAFESLLSYHTEGAQIRHLLIPHFKAALKDRKITAWICANDFAAAIALDFLKEQGIRVPKQIAVAGFDNDEIAASRRLTSVDFNIPKVVAAALLHLAGPRATGGTKRDIEVECEIIERESTL